MNAIYNVDYFLEYISLIIFETGIMRWKELYFTSYAHVETPFPLQIVYVEMSFPCVPAALSHDTTAYRLHPKHGRYIPYLSADLRHCDTVYLTLYSQCRGIIMTRMRISMVDR